MLDVKIWDAREREPVPLSMLHSPFCVTFNFYGEEGEELVLIDAGLSEEQCKKGEVILTVNKYGELCQMAKYGGSTVDAIVLLSCSRVAVKKVRERELRILDLPLPRATPASLRRKLF